MTKLFSNILHHRRITTVTTTLTSTSTTTTTILTTTDTNLINHIHTLLIKTPPTTYTTTFTPFLHHLRHHHINHLLLATVNHPQLSLRFFNFLGLHLHFPLSLSSFAILIHSLSNSRLFWPASSLLHTLTLNPNPRNPNPNSSSNAALFHHLYDAFCEHSHVFPSSYAFDLLVQCHVQSRRPMSAVEILRLMLRHRILPEVICLLTKMCYPSGRRPLLFQCHLHLLKKQVIRNPVSLYRKRGESHDGYRDWNLRWYSHICSN